MTLALRVAKTMEVSAFKDQYHPISILEVFLIASSLRIMRAFRLLSELSPLTDFYQQQELQYLGLSPLLGSQI